MKYVKKLFMCDVIFINNSKISMIALFKIGYYYI